ncbi:squamosa promoter-binding-like protein 8 [Tanacetum coccineum]
MARLMISNYTPGNCLRELKSGSKNFKNRCLKYFQQGQDAFDQWWPLNQYSEEASQFVEVLNSLDVVPVVINRQRFDPLVGWIGSAGKNRSAGSDELTRHTSRVYQRSTPLDATIVSSSRCQTEGCDVDLTHAKHYHRRHKATEENKDDIDAVIVGTLSDQKEIFLYLFLESELAQSRADVKKSEAQNDDPWLRMGSKDAERRLGEDAKELSKTEWVYLKQLKGLADTLVITLDDLKAIFPRGCPRPNSVVC